MADQVSNAIIFRPTAKACDETLLLSRSDLSSHFPSPASKAKKEKNTKKRLGSIICLKGLAAPAVYLIKKVRGLGIWCLGNETVTAAAASDHQTGTALVEPYFSIPVVVPI